MMIWPALAGGRDLRSGGEESRLTAVCVIRMRGGQICPVEGKESRRELLQVGDKRIAGHAVVLEIRSGPLPYRSRADHCPRSKRKRPARRRAETEAAATLGISTTEDLPPAQGGFA